MFHFFERKRLVKKGLASAKVRRRRTRSEFRCTLETGLGVKAGIFTLFCLGLAMLILSGSQTQPVEKLSDRAAHFCHGADAALDQSPPFLRQQLPAHPHLRVDAGASGADQGDPGPGA